MSTLPTVVLSCVTSFAISIKVMADDDSDTDHDGTHGGTHVAHAWSHHTWFDDSLQLGYHVLYADTLPLGSALRWEWRYMAQYLEISSDLWDYWKMFKNNTNLIFYMHGIGVSMDAFKYPKASIAPTAIEGQVQTERSTTTLGMYGLLCHTATLSRTSKPITKTRAIKVLLSLLHIGIQHAYALVPAAVLILPVDCSEPLDGDCSIQHMVVNHDGYLSGFHHVCSRFGDLAGCWKAYPDHWHYHQLQSSIEKPLLRDLILVLMWATTSTAMLKQPNHMWNTCGRFIFSSVLWLMTVLLETYIIHKVLCGPQPVNPRTLPLLLSKGGKPRRPDTCNKVNWLKQFRKVRSVSSRALQLLTDHTLLPSQQKGCVSTAYSFYMANLAKTYHNIHRIQLVWDSSVHHEDTMVFIMWSHMNSVAGYPAIQVLQKLIQQDVASVGDEDLQLLLMEGKLKLQSAFTYIKAVEGALVSVDKTLAEFRCPNELLLEPLAKNQLRVKHSNGNFYIVNTLTHEAIRQIPDNFNWDSLPVLCHMIDQSQIGVAACYHMMHHMRLMVFVMYDYYHRTWNDIKNAARSSKGFFFSTMLKYSLVFNLNYGPFGKGGWFLDKQTFLKEMALSCSSTHQFFRARAPDIAEDIGRAEPVTDQDYKDIWDFVVGFQKGFKLKGPLTKVMRWFSFFEGYDFYRKELNSLKLVLDWHFQTCHDPDEDEANVPAPVLPLNQPDAKTELAELKKALGGLRLAAKIITPTSLWSLDCLFRVVQELWLYTGLRQKTIKTAEDFRQDLIATCTARTWLKPVCNTVMNCFHDQGCFEHLTLYADMEGYSHDKLDQFCDFTLHVITNRTMSLIGFETEPPYRYAGLVSQDTRLQTLALARMKLDWRRLLELESALAIDPKPCKAVTACCWRLCLPIRAVFVAMEACDYDLDSQVGQSAVALLNSMLEVLGDSKCIEDTHKHLRDQARDNSNNVTSRASRHHCCHTSPVLEQRGVNAASISDKELAQAYWRKRQSVYQIIKATQTSSVKATKDMLDILQTHQTSPTPAIMYQSVAATSWVLDSYWEQAQPLSAPWQSVMVGQHSILRHKSSTDAVLTLNASQWGVLAWQLDYLGPQEQDPEFHTWTLNVEQSNAVVWKYVTKHTDWEIIDYTFTPPTRYDQCPIMLQQTSSAKSVIAHGLLAGVQMTKEQVIQILDDIGSTDFLKSAPKDVLILHLVKTVFSNPAEESAARNAYSKPGLEVELGGKVEEDSDLEDLIEAHDYADAANPEEIKKLKQARTAKKRHSKQSALDEKFQARLKERADKKHKAMQAKVAKKSKQHPKAKGTAKARAKAKSRPQTKAQAKAKVRASGKAKATDHASANVDSSEPTAPKEEVDDFGNYLAAHHPELIMQPNSSTIDIEAYLFGDSDDEEGDLMFEGIDWNALREAGHVQAAPSESLSNSLPSTLPAADTVIKEELESTLHEVAPPMSEDAAVARPSGISEPDAPPEPSDEPPAEPVAPPGPSDATAAEQSDLHHPDSKPRAAAVNPSPKQYHTPQCLLPLGVTPTIGIKLDCRAHRFNATFNKCPGDDQLTGKYAQLSHACSFNVEDRASWVKSLQQCHTWLWTKWNKLPADMRPQTVYGEQTPGDVSAAIIDTLAAEVMDNLPPKQNYSLTSKK